MTINRTTLLDLPLPVTGTESGVWGDVVNNGLSQYIDISVAGSLSLSADSDTNLSSTEGDASATNIGSTTAQYAILRCTGARTATRNINAPAWAISGGTLTNYSKIYIVVNETTGSQNIVLRATDSATPTYTTGVTIVPGERAVCAWNGSDFVKVGGAAGGSTTQIQFNNAGVFGGISNATTDGTTLSMTSPKVITGINDTNGNELLKVTATASAVNELTLANAATGGNPVLSATGGDTNIGITLTPKGTGGVVFPAGAVGTPAITTTGDTNTGVYFPAADTAAITTDGTERMRIDSSGNVGIGTSSISNKLEVNGSARFYTAAQGDISITHSGLISSITAAGSVGLALGTNNAERMRITSAGVLTAAAASTVASNWPTGTSQIFRLNGATYAGISFGDPEIAGAANRAAVSITAWSGGGSNYYTSKLTTLGDGTLTFSTQATASTDAAGTSTERMRIDSSGNVGIGATPSAWISTVKALDINTGAAFVGTSNAASVWSNTFIDSGSNYRYKTTAAAAYYSQSSGAHAWYAAASGSAGSIPTFTQILNIEKDKSLALQGATSQTGTGITFPATQSASSDANTLDDYEEGTWTPTLTGSSSDPTVTYTTQTGQYTKVGRVVHVQCGIVPATYSGGSGNLRIGGLPFQSGSSTFYVTGSAYLDGVDIGASRTWATSYVAPGVSYIRLLTSQNNGAASEVAVSGVSAGDNLIIGITYMV